MGSLVTIIRPPVVMAAGWYPTTSSWGADRVVELDALPPHN